jgi:hypothetical protein
MSDEDVSAYPLRRRNTAPPPPPATPRGKKGGRRAGPLPGSQQRKRMKQLAERAQDPLVIERRMETRAVNEERRAQLEVARVYKASHGVGSRLREVVAERVVYVRPERKVVREAEMRSVEHILSENEQAWLRLWVRREAVTKDGSKFTKEIIVAIQAQFGKELSKQVMRGVLYSMGIQWHRLYPGYFRAKAAEEYNVARRALIVPVLHFLQCRKDVIVWNYDQCHAVVNDFVGMGWCDMTDTGSQYKEWVKKSGETGDWLTISAFISEAFGLLLDGDSRHVGRLAKITSNANVVAEDFEAAAALVNARWPQYLHIFQTDSPNVHTQLIAGACNPNGINKSDGGANRERDNIFGTRGLQWIFEEFYGEDKTRVNRQTVAELRKRLWDKPEVRGQLFRLEEVCQRHGSLLLFNCVGHPQLAPIELLWRDVKYNYRVDSRKTAAQLLAHWRGWLCADIDAEWVAGYYRSTNAFVSYYLHGGTHKITERAARRGAEECFETLLPDGAQIKTESMSKLFARVPALRAANADELLLLLQPYLHALNMMHKRKSLVLDPAGE